MQDMGVIYMSKDQEVYDQNLNAFKLKHEKHHAAMYNYIR